MLCGSNLVLGMVNEVFGLSFFLIHGFEQGFAFSPLNGERGIGVVPEWWLRKVCFLSHLAGRVGLTGAILFRLMCYHSSSANFELVDFVSCSV